MKLRTFALLGIIFAAVQTSNATAILITQNVVTLYPTLTSASSILLCANQNNACSGSSLAPNTLWTMDYFAQSQATFGKLQAEASVDVTGNGFFGPYQGTGQAASLAAFQDTFTVTGGTGAGILNLGFALSGTSSTTPGGRTLVYFALEPFVNGQPDYSHSEVVPVDANSNIAVLPIAFNFGVPVEFYLAFVAVAEIDTWQAGASAHADYFHTAILNAITVTDSQNNSVLDFGITSGSGATYGPNGVVPEPASIYLVSSALVVLGIRRRLRRIN